MRTRVGARLRRFPVAQAARGGFEDFDLERVAGRAVIGLRAAAVTTRTGGQRAQQEQNGKAEFRHIRASNHPYLRVGSTIEYT